MEVNPDDVRRHAQKVATSAVFRGSDTYSKLLLYLVDSTLADAVPKEVGIAIEVFGKSADLNASEGPQVRVYVHNLRKKLDQYYSSEGADDALRLSIPKGGYRVLFDTPVRHSSERRKPAAWWKALVALLLVSFAANIYLFREHVNAVDPVAATIAKGMVWSGLFENRRPTLVVMGDLFAFHETDPRLNRRRLVRDYSINSAREFEAFRTRFPEVGGRTEPADIQVLVKSGPLSLQHLLPVFDHAREAFDLRLMSKLTADEVRDNDVVFIGLYKSLGILRPYFDGSRFAMQPPFTRLVDRKGGREIRLVGDANAYHRDYGVLASFKGPAGGRIVLVAGFTDTSVVQIVKDTTNPARARAVEDALRKAGIKPDEDFEILFEVGGYDRTDLDARVRAVGRVDSRRIWAAVTPR